MAPSASRTADVDRALHRARLAGHPMPRRRLVPGRSSGCPGGGSSTKTASHAPPPHRTGAAHGSCRNPRTADSRTRRARYPPSMRRDVPPRPPLPEPKDPKLDTPTAATPRASKSLPAGCQGRPDLVQSATVWLRLCLGASKRKCCETGAQRMNPSVVVHAEAVHVPACPGSRIGSGCLDWRVVGCAAAGCCRKVRWFLLCWSAMLAD